MTSLNDLAAAFMLLTRLPVGALIRPAASPAKAAWCFPVVGAVVGLLAAFVLAAANRLHLPPLMGAAWTLAALLLLTGAIHEDGLADTADGFGGGAAPAAKLAIMRDSRIGSFGALALIVSVLVRVSGIAALPPSLGIAGLVAVGAVARAGMLVVLLMLPCARPGGLGDVFAAGKPSGPVFGMMIAASLCFGLLPRHAALLVLLACGVAAVMMALVARRQVGGYTGDILGAIEQLGEMVALTVLAMI